MTEIVLILLLAAVSYFAKGVVGAASAIVFNAGLLTALALGLGGEFTLLDGLYWVALADCFSSVLMAVSLRRQLKLEKFVVLMLAGMLPVQLVFTLLLTRLELNWLQILLAVSVIGAGVYLAAQRNPRPAPMPAINRAAAPVGVIAGVLSGLFGMAGPVIFLLVAKADPDPSVFRRRMVVISTIATVMRVITIALQSQFTSQRLAWFGIALPVILVFLALGMWAHRRVKPPVFRVVLGVLVIVAGLGALLRSVT